MARSDLLIKLVSAGYKGDYDLFKKIVEAIIAEERQKQHNILADNLNNIISQNNRHKSINNVNDRCIEQFVYESTPQLSINDLILNEDNQSICKDFVEEHQRKDILRSYNLEPRNRVLLIGPPGNGKTSLAEALANELMLPFIVVRYDGIIGSYLGETSARLKKLFDYVKTRNCVLFFDEFDTIGKERGDIHETGEIKRVVSSLLLQVDRLPSYVVVITATNHPELLDRAVWRRFQIKLNLKKPTKQQIEDYFKRFAETFEHPIGVALPTLSKNLLGLSFGEIEDFKLDILRRFVLSLPEGNMKTIIKEQFKKLSIYTNSDKIENSNSEEDNG